MIYVNQLISKKMHLSSVLKMLYLPFFLLSLGVFAQGEDLVEEVLKANRDMETAFNEKNYEGVAAFYADDAVLVSRSYEVKGRDALDAYWTGMEGRGISWKLENLEIIPDTKTAVQRGISHLRYVNKEGEEVLSQVKFTLLWIKEEGQWKIRIDHYSRL